MEFSIAVCIPYFGILPSFYPAWRRSVLSNSTIDFYLITNDTAAQSYGNLHVIHMDLSNYVSIIEKKLKRKITCDHPYKLCDYKPTIGVILEDFLKKYDFWGYCDMDLVFGDIRTFITSEILQKYKRVFYNGHLSLYRNIPEVNNLFLNDGPYPEYNFSEVCSTNEACYFDEFRGMELKSIRNKVSVYKDKHDICDIAPEKANLVYHGISVTLIWSNGHLYCRYPDGSEKEKVYVHIQKRKMESIDIDDTTSEFSIVAGKLIAGHDTYIDYNEISYMADKVYELRYYWKKFIKAMKKNGIRKNYSRYRRKK